MARSGRIQGRQATLEDYDRIFETEHLHKFSGPEVGFVARSPVQQHCGDCIHWFENPYSGWTPCEIMSLGKPVPAAGACRFWNQGNKSYPLLRVL